ncbi:MAG: hypothetical protein WC315_00390 [Candidatus Omnitrophota bacterium]|jgi:hypothetical protein
MIRRVLQRVLKIVGRVLRLTTAVLTFAYVVPVILIGYVYGLTTASFRLGRTLSAVAAATAINKVFERIQ